MRRKRKKAFPKAERETVRDELFRVFQEAAAVARFSPDWGMKVEAAKAAAEVAIAYFLSALEDEDREALIAIAGYASGKRTLEGEPVKEG
ncbi:MAG: hypothetical protein ABDH20_09620 [Thermus sp.]